MDTNPGSVRMLGFRSLHPHDSGPWGGDQFWLPEVPCPS